MQYLDIEDIFKLFSFEITGKEPESWEELKKKIDNMIDDVPEVSKEDLRKELGLESNFNPENIDIDI